MLWCYLESVCKSKDTLDDHKDEVYLHFQRANIVRRSSPLIAYYNIALFPYVRGNCPNMR